MYSNISKFMEFLKNKNIDSNIKDGRNFAIANPLRRGSYFLVRIDSINWEDSSINILLYICKVREKYLDKYAPDAMKYYIKVINKVRRSKFKLVLIRRSKFKLVLIR